MNRKLRGTLKAVWPLLVGLLLCEYLIYYPVLWKCGYPKLAQDSGDEEVLKVMLLSDTHLLGSRHGHWFDKLRREWQMRRAFQTAQTLFSPDLVVFLGDVFDEAKWCGPDEFRQYLARFEDMFAVAAHTQVKVVAGNHDIGFHYAVTPYLVSRFERAFGAPSVDMFSMKGVTFVTVNSVAMADDGCSMCNDAKEKLAEVSKRLDCLTNKGGGECEVDYDFMADEVIPDDNKRGFASKPVLLQHYPLFRTSDNECVGQEEADWAPAQERGNLFRGGWECVSKESSRRLLDEVKPRAVFSGHTHHGCFVRHDSGSVPEWSVSSFSWRNRENPTFLLATMTTSDFAVDKCYLPYESTVIRMYWLVLLAFLFILLKKKLSLF